jgi:hypothetical protein
MATTLEELANRVRLLEEQLARVTELLREHAFLETPAERGARCYAKGKSANSVWRKAGLRASNAWASLVSR